MSLIPLLPPTLINISVSAGILVIMHLGLETNVKNLDYQTTSVLCTEGWIIIINFHQVSCYSLRTTTIIVLENSLLGFFLSLRCRTYPGDQELFCKRIGSVYSLPQQGNERYQIKGGTFCHNILQSERHENCELH